MWSLLRHFILIGNCPLPLKDRFKAVWQSWRRPSTHKRAVVSRWSCSIVWIYILLHLPKQKAYSYQYSHRIPNTMLRFAPENRPPLGRKFHLPTIKFQGGHPDQTCRSTQANSWQQPTAHHVAYHGEPHPNWGSEFFQRSGNSPLLVSRDLWLVVSATCPQKVFICDTLGCSSSQWQMKVYRDPLLKM